MRPSPRRETGRRLATVLLGAALAAGCERTPAPPPDPPVARGNGVEVLQSAFADEYRQFASMAPLQDGLDARRRYARLMLERAFIAARGDAAGLDSLPDVQGHVARQRDFAMRRVFLHDTLEARIAEPTEADVREAFERTGTRLRLQQIYAPTEAAARAAAARLAAGASFDSLAAASMRAAGVTGGAASAGHMGWVTWNDLDLAPEAAAFALARGEVSAPVRSGRGWHLFRMLDREETVRLDATAYASARERLGAELRQRRLDEAAAAYLEPLLTAHTLEIRLATLRQLWPALAPFVPAQPSAQAAVTVREQVPGLQPEGLSRATAVALVDGRPFTVGQLLDALPEVPFAWWAPDLRQAVEVAVRDSILTARAAAAGAGAHPDVARAVAAARSTALYYATLRAAADTVQTARYAARFYERWKAGAFVASRTTAYRAAAFADSAAARAALSAHGVSARDGEARTVTSAAGEAGPFGVHRLAEGVPAGPFRDGARWVVVVPTAHTDAYVPFAEAAPAVRAMMAAEPRAVVHEVLLARGFDPDAVVFDDAALQAALPLVNAPPGDAPPGDAPPGDMPAGNTPPARPPPGSPAGPGAAALPPALALRTP